MKKTSILIVSVFAVTTFNSCTNEQGIVADDNNLGQAFVLTPEELTSISFDQPSELSEAEVSSIVTNFIHMENEGAETRSISTPKLTVKNKSYLGKQPGTGISRSAGTEAVESIPIYDIMVEDEGRTSYSIVSADERAPGVLAFFDNLPTADSEIQRELNSPNARAILSLAKYQLIQDVEKVEKIKAELREQTIQKICDYLNIPVSEYAFETVIGKLKVNGSSLTRNHAGTQTPPGVLVTQKAPMCQITWNQWVPYNQACPMGKIFISLGEFGFVNDGNVPAGCVTIACLHVEACVERSSIGGTPMNWNYYKSAKILNETTPALYMERAGKVIRYIYDQLQSFPMYDYYNGERYVHATGSGLGSSYIMSNFNYEHSQTFDPDVVLSSLNANKPVYISGSVYGNSVENPNEYGTEGHAFVIDGYMITTKTASSSSAYTSQANSRANIVQFYDMYWHLNLGWGSNSSAYFKLESDATCSPEFFDELGRYNLMHLKDMAIISHISKK